MNKTRAATAVLVEVLMQARLFASAPHALPRSRASTKCGWNKEKHLFISGTAHAAWQTASLPCACQKLAMVFHQQRAHISAPTHLRLCDQNGCTAPCQQYNGVPNRPSAAHKQGVPLHCVCGLICTLSLGQLCSCGDCCACSPSPFHAPFLPLAFPMQTGGIGTPHPLTCGISALSS